MRNRRGSAIVKTAVEDEMLQGRVAHIARHALAYS
jgi:hypothetical protein